MTTIEKEIPVSRISKKMKARKKRSQSFKSFRKRQSRSARKCEQLELKNLEVKTKVGPRSTSARAFHKTSTRS